MTSAEHADTSEREWVGPSLAQCWTCEAVVLVRDGALVSHYRYVDESNPYSNQPHDLIQCEGERTL